MDLEDDYLTSLKSSSEEPSEEVKGKDDTIPSNNTSVVKDEIKNDNPTKSSVEDNVENSKSIKEKEKKTKEIQTTKEIPPPGWFFPSWFSFISYGPFVPKDNRLPLLEISDASKKTTKSRAEKRKANKVEKDAKRVNDTQFERGFSTDQKVQLEMLGLQRQSTTDRGRESILMGLCVQEGVIAKQIDQAERMASQFALDAVDDPNNKWWKKLNDLILKQETIVIEMANLNKKALIVENNTGEFCKKISIHNFNQNPLTNKSGLSLLPNTITAEILSDLSKDSDTAYSSNTSD